VADLAVVQTAPSQVRAGSDMTNKITVSNFGPDVANLVALQYRSILTNLGTLAPGASATVSFVVPAGNVAPITMTNRAQVTSAAVDPDTANNVSITTTIVYTQPRLGSVSYSGATGSFGMNVQTVNGLTYFVEYKNALDDATWTLLKTFPGTGGSVPVVDDTADAVPMRFYRLGIQEP